jgi:L-seryl-tRNA(Ser) seleniumtransferase
VSDPRSRIPSVDAILADGHAADLVERFGRSRVVDAVRAAVERVRAGLAGNDRAPDASGDVTDPQTYLDLARRTLQHADVPSLRHVINATGVVLHTNLGRAPLAEEAVRAMHDVAGRYTNLEFDLESGARGSRYVHCVALLTDVTGAEDALVVNNAAAALVLALNTFGQGRGIAVSRGELVEIGGGFRIPEMLERAGARLVEVGSTNRTRVGDYAEAIEAGDVAAVLKVHRSNFRITGFTEEATVGELYALCRTHGLPLVHDLGSGLLIDAGALGLPQEPRAVDSLRAGADVVVVSGDKLMGAPQAGVILGRAAHVARMRKNPLCRALRVDKVTLAGLEATLRLYGDPDRVLGTVPTLAMLSAPVEALDVRARALADALERGGVRPEVVETSGAVGGGTYPGVELPSRGVELRHTSGADALALALRQGHVPVVGRILDDGLRLDVRTVLPGQDETLAECVLDAWRRLG